MDDSYLRYIQQDYTSQRTALIDRLRLRWPGEWSDFSQNSIGMALVDIIAWNTSTLAYAMQSQLSESYSSSMRLRESAIRIGNSFLYRLHGPTPASLKCIISLPSALQVDSVFSHGSIVNVQLDDGTSLPFELVDDVVISAGKFSPEKVTAEFRYGSSYTGAVDEVVSNLVFTQGSRYVDATNTTFDLSTLIESGNELLYGGEYYSIDELSNQPGTLVSNRIVLTDPYSGSTAAATDVVVYDRSSTFIQGQRVNDNFVTPKLPGNNYCVALTRSGVLDGSISVSINGQVWSERDPINIASSSDAVYSVRLLPTGYYIIQFGDGSDGQVVPSSSSISVSYRVGVGSSGNISAGLMKSSIKGIGANNQLVTASVTNLVQGKGGHDEESVDEARLSIPRYIAANRRCVTQSDYETIALSYVDAALGRLARASANSGASSNSYLDGNVVTLYVWYNDGTGITASVPSPLCQAVEQYVQARCVSTDIVHVLSGSTQPVPLSALIRLASGFSKSAVIDSANTAMSSYLASLDVGETFKQQDAFSILSALPGVDTVSVVTPTSDISPSSRQEMWIDADKAGWQKLSYSETTANQDGTITIVYQVPVFPLSCWGISIRQESGGVSKSVFQLYPSADYGQAEIIPTPDNALTSGSLNLSTGRLELTYTGTAIYDISYSMSAITTYANEHQVDLWVNYSGINNQAKRAEIRAALKAWIHNFGPGYNLYASKLDGIAASSCNVSDVVAAISGVDAVTSVSFDSPQTSKTTVQVSSDELVVLRKIVILGYAN